MGNSYSEIVNKISASLGFRSQEIRVLTLGLDAAGKTTMLYQMKLGEVVTTIPTIGFNVETLKYKNVNFTVWDVGGRDKIRPLYRHYYQNTQAIICVIDSNDRERIGEIKSEMEKFLNEDELRDCVVVVLANKQDLPNAMKVDEVSKCIELDTIKHKHNIFGTVATTGDGLTEALDWLHNAFKQKSYDNNKLIEPLNDTVNDLKKISSIAANTEIKSWMSYFNNLPSKLFKTIS